MNEAPQLESQSYAWTPKQVTTELTIREMSGASKHARYEQTQKAIDRRKRYKAKRKAERIAARIAGCRGSNDCPVVLRVGVSEQDIALDTLLVNAFDLQKSPAERLHADLSSRISGKGRRCASPASSCSKAFPDDEPLFFLHQQLSIRYPYVFGGPTRAELLRREELLTTPSAPKLIPRTIISEKRGEKVVVSKSRGMNGKPLSGRLPRRSVGDIRLLQQAAALGGVA